MPVSGVTAAESCVNDRESCSRGTLRLSEWITQWLVMGLDLRRPSKRVCEECGRSERHPDDADSWRVNGSKGDPYCIHEWDINGEFVPYEYE